MVNIACVKGEKICHQKWQHDDREIPNKIRLQHFSRLIGISILQFQLYEYRPRQAVAFHERGGFMPGASPQHRTSQPHMISLYI